MSKDAQKNREAVKRHYEKNKQYYIEKNRKARQRKAEYLKSLKEVPCMDCKTQYPDYVMEFDHRENKEFCIPRMTSMGWERIKNEVAKCDIVCANCHSVRTYIRRTKFVSVAQRQRQEA